MRGLGDFKANDISKFKLDKLIQTCPPIGYFSNDFVFEKLEIRNPEFDENQIARSRNYMNSLILEVTKGEDISIETRLELVSKFLPDVDKKFPAQDEFIFVEEKRTFKEFSKID